MTQPDLFSYQARRTDHDSSHLAAKRHEASGRAQLQRDQVCALVQRWPGSTSLELATLGKLDRHLVGRRLPDLEHRRLLRSVRAKGEEIRWWPV